MNGSILGLGLIFITGLACAQQAPSGICISERAIDDCIGLDEQTLLVDAGRKDYLMTLESCSTLTGRHCIGSPGNPGIAFETFARPRICEGQRIIIHIDNQLQYCVIQDIVRYQVNPATNAIEINEFED